MTEYPAILISSIREGVSIPFECYLHLKSNDKYISANNSGDPPNDDLLKKLSGHNISNLFIKTSELSNYKNYISAFLNSNEGIEALKNLSEEEAKNLLHQGIDISGQLEKIASEQPPEDSQSENSNTTPKLLTQLQKKSLSLTRN